MSTSIQAWIVIATVALGTYAIRASFRLVAHRFGSLSPTVREILRMIPAASLAALVAPAILRPEGRLDFLSPEFLAGLVALVVAWRTRSIFGTIAIGLIAIVAFEHYGALG